MKIFKIIYLIFCLVPFIAQSAPKKVFVLQIRQEIDPRMSRYVTQALEQAKKIEAELIIVDMNTYGGAVDDADKIRTAFLESITPIWVFINKNAASAGALISIACDSIYMEPGSSIGAATVVNGQDGQAMPDKYQSYMRSMMRATAETNKRNPTIAEAMVDPDVILDSTIKKTGKVLTFTTSEAIKNKFCEAEVNSIEQLLQRNQIVGYELVKFELTTAERIISFFLNPAISGILILIMIGGIYFELQTPGIGFPLIAAIIAAILYFTPYYLNGLAQNWEILVFILGLILLGLEIFVIPGFGITGIAGIILIFSSLILSMLNNDFLNFDFVATQDLYYSMTSVLISLVATIILIIYGSSKLMKSAYFKKISLNDQSIKPYTANDSQSTSLIGKDGLTLTTLRPSGMVEIEGVRYDAITSGELIEKDTSVKVVEYSMGNLKVKKI